MVGKVIERGFWKGIEINWVGKMQRATKGVAFSLRYLTAANSPFVLIQWVITNKTNAPLKFWPTLFVDSELNQNLAGGSYQTIWDDEVVELRKGMIPVPVTPTTSVVWLKPEAEEIATSGFSFMIAGSDASLLAAVLGESMLLGGVDGMTWLMPNEEKVINAGILVDPMSMDDIQDLQSTLHRF